MFKKESDVQGVSKSTASAVSNRPGSSSNGGTKVENQQTSTRVDSCCGGGSVTMTKEKGQVSSPTSTMGIGTRKGTSKIVVRYDVGFNNTLFIRGNGPNLSWDKGVPLRNVKSDEWVWETDQPFTTCEFKVLLNDQNYECGNNRHLAAGSVLQYTPHFDR